VPVIAPSSRRTANNTSTSGVAWRASSVSQASRSVGATIQGRWKRLLARICSM
jgi:hypothetical protein